MRGLAELEAADTAAVEATIVELEGLAATSADETERKSALYLRGMLQSIYGATGNRSRPEAFRGTREQACGF